MRNKNDGAWLMIIQGSIFLAIGIFTAFIMAAVAYGSKTDFDKGLGIFVAVLVVGGAVLVSVGALLGATVWRERS